MTLIKKQTFTPRIAAIVFMAFSLLLLLLSCGEPGVLTAGFMLFGVPRILFDAADDTGAAPPAPEASPAATEAAAPADAGYNEDAELEALLSETAESLNNPVEEDDFSLSEAEIYGKETGGADKTEDVAPEKKQPPRSDTNKDTPPAVNADEVFEVEGEEGSFYYHAKLHGSEADQAGKGQGTAYKTRDMAEYGFMNKLEKFVSNVKSLNESGKGLGVVDLPDWINDPNNLEAIKELGSEDQVFSLDNEGLRDRIKNMDSLISSTNTRLKTVQAEQQQAQTTEKITAMREATSTEINNLMDELALFEDVSLDFNKEGSLQAFRGILEKARDKKVAEAIKADVKKYTDYRDSDARFDDDAYATKLEEMYEALHTKKQEVAAPYNQKIDGTFTKLNELGELVKSAEQPDGGEETTAQKAERVMKVLGNYGKEVRSQAKEKGTELHPIFETSDEQVLGKFFNFALERSDDFNGLKTTFDAHRAFKAFEAHNEKLRAKFRAKSVESNNVKTEAKAKDIPGYGNQEDLRSGFDTDDEDAELAELMSETRKVFG